MTKLYSQVKNPKWANQDHTIIDCEVNFTHLPDEFVPFTAIPTDVMEYSKTIFDECLAGQYGEIAEYEPPAPIVIPEPTKDELMAKLLEIQSQLERLS